jgi:anti-sigma factor RsiW
MDCEKVSEMLDLLMDGALDEAQRQALEAHGRHCPECSAAIRSTLQMKALFDRMEPEADVPLETQARWREAVRAEEKAQKQKRLRRWFASAAAAVVLLVGVGMVFRLQGTPGQNTTRMYDERMAMQVEEKAVEPVLAAGNAVARQPSDAVASAVVEADGVADEAVAIADYEAGMAVSEEAHEAEEAASGQRAPACELTLEVDDVSVACDRINDLAQEYEAVADIQAAGDGRANVFVEIAAENAGDFLNAVAPINASGEAVKVPELTGSGRVLVLLALRE